MCYASACKPVQSSSNVQASRAIGCWWSATELSIVFPQLPYVRSLIGSDRDRSAARECTSSCLRQPASRWYSQRWSSRSTYRVSAVTRKWVSVLVDDDRPGSDIARYSISGLLRVCLHCDLIWRSSDHRRRRRCIRLQCERHAVAASERVMIGGLSFETRDMRLCIALFNWFHWLLFPTMDAYDVMQILLTADHHGPRQDLFISIKSEQWQSRQSCYVHFSLIAKYYMITVYDKMNLSTW